MGDGRIKRKRIARWTILFLALDIGVVGLWGLSNRDLLPRGSVPVISVDLWTVPPPRTVSALVPSLLAPVVYFWTTTGDLVHAETAPDGSTDLVREHMIPAHLMRDKAEPFHIPKGAALVSLTPDGSRLLYGWKSPTLAYGTELHTLTEEGRDHRLFSVPPIQNMVWMPDCKSWITSRIPGEVLYNLEGKPARELNTLSLSDWTPYVLGINAQGHAIATVGTDFFESDPALRYTARNYPDFQFLEFDPAAPGSNPKRWKAPAPPQVARGRVLLSPQADRILWIVDKKPSFLARWKEKLRLKERQDIVGEQAVYVSHLDGSSMHELCTLPVEGQKTGTFVNGREPLTYFRWLPDGKRISYVYQNVLFIAPVD